MRTEDGYIIKECLSGELESFGILVDKYKEGIYAFVYAKLCDFRDAQDVTQEVFLHAYRNLHTLRRWESFASWIYRIAHRRCKLWIRAQSRRIDREFIEDQNLDVIDAPALRSYCENEISESVHGALDVLPEAYREVLMLRYFGGMNSSEIARVLGTSPGAIRVRLNRARTQLKEEMITAMGAAFEEQRLRTGFTFRIVEAVRRIKVNPMPRAAGLPWGLSLAAGMIIAVLSLSPHVSIPIDVATSTGSPLSMETKVRRTGEITVDMLKTSEISVIASNQGNGDSGKPQHDPQNALMLSPKRDEGGTWMTMVDMPTARWGAGCGAVNGKIYVIGGNSGFLVGDAPVSFVEEYDPATGKWVKKGDMKTDRRSLEQSIVVVNGRIYVISGYDEDDKLLPTVEEYNPVSDRWIKRADMPTLRESFCTSVANGKIYTIGGGTWKSPFLNFSTVEEYDPVSDKWTSKADMPTARLDLSSSAANGKIYAIGGMMHHSNFGCLIVEEYDPITDKWTRKADMPTARRGHSAVTVNGKIYVIGGVTDDVFGFPTVEEYDPVLDKWTRKADMPTGRMYLWASAVKGKIYAIGGVTAGADRRSIISLAVEEYDTGFGGESIDFKGKLPTTWGQVRTALNK